MSRNLRLPGLLALVLAMLAACSESAKEEHEAFLPQYEKIDLLIEYGSVFDGYGNPPVLANVVIVGDEIVFVGETAFTEDDLANRVLNRINAYDKAVTPGFIDLHSHGDPLETPQFENFLAMGVTTIVLGQDGSSPDVEPLSDWLGEVSARGIGTNLAMFVGHGTLRDQSGIGLATSPETEQMEYMLESLDRTLQYTFGLSTGLEYNPGLNATTDELRALAKVVGRNDRMIMSHMRNEDDEQLENSIAELLEQGEDARVHISHLKSVYGKGGARAEEILRILADARDAGTNITADIYPYTASYTGIDILFPVWAKTDEQFAVAKAERREELAAFLRDKVNRRNGPEATLLGTDPYTGKTLAELSFEMELPFEDVLIDTIGPHGASGAYFVMDDELQARLLQDANVGVCSDGSPNGFHPRGHGTFAKIIEKYVLEDNLLSPVEAISKLTAFPANVLGIADRGAVRANMKADLLVFDMAAIHAPASYPEPLQLAEGFDIVIVNGKIARQYGIQDRNLYGRVLEPGR
jgi:N-acyl-D-amino-acid deacylase